MEFFGYSRQAAACGNEERDVGLRYCAVLDKHPNLRDFVGSRCYSKNPAKTALFYLALSDDRRIIEEIILRADLLSACLVKVDTSATLERDGLTDIFTYGAASCAYWIIDKKTLVHLSFPAEEYCHSDLESFLPLGTPRPKKTLLIIPGGRWTEANVRYLRRTGVSHNFAGRSRVTVYDPGDWVTWIGFRDGEIKNLSYEWKRNTILR